MDAATAGLIGAAVGFLANALVTWINRHFDERKARRELMIKAAWDYYALTLNKSQPEVPTAPFSTYLFHTVKTVELAMRKNLSDQKIAEEMRRINKLEAELIRISEELPLR